MINSINLFLDKTYSFKFNWAKLYFFLTFFCYGFYAVISKFNNEQERGSGAPAALAKSLGGPAPQQLLDAVAYRKGFSEMFATSLPYYGTYDVIFGVFVIEIKNGLPLNVVHFTITEHYSFL